MGACCSYIKQSRKRRELALREKAKRDANLPRRQVAADGGLSGGIFVIDNPGRIEEFYDIDKHKIGEGSFGRVCKCNNKSTGFQRAVKIMKKRRNPRLNTVIRHEIAIMKLLDHPNAVKLLEHFEDTHYIYMIQELCTGGELFDRLVELGHFTEKQAACLMLHLCRGVFYMHSQQVVHRDLKIENLLLTTNEPIESNTLKICDFGLARMFEPGEVMNTKCGAPYFIAPQVLAGRYTEAADLWTVGVLMYTLICGYPPFFGDSDAEVLSKVRLGNFSFNAADWKHVSEEAKEMVRGLLKMNPQDRLTSRESLHHTWIMQKAPRTRAPIKLKYIENLKAYADFALLKKAALQMISSQLDEEYKRPLVETFMWLDDSGEGLVSAAEIRQGLQKAGFKEEDIPPDLDEVMARVDTDGSGEIDYSEFVAATLDPRVYTREEICWAAFRIFDRNGDGEIAPRELQDVLNNGREGGFTREDCKAMLKEVDDSADKRIDFDEFVNMMKGIKFKKVDEDKEGEDGGGKKKKKKKKKGQQQQEGQQPEGEEQPLLEGATPNVGNVDAANPVVVEMAAPAIEPNGEKVDPDAAVGAEDKSAVVGSGAEEGEKKKKEKADKGKKKEKGEKADKGEKKAVEVTVQDANPAEANPALEFSEPAPFAPIEDNAPDFSPDGGAGASSSGGAAASSSGLAVAEEAAGEEGASPDVGKKEKRKQLKNGKTKADKGKATE